VCVGGEVVFCFSFFHFFIFVFFVGNMQSAPDETFKLCRIYDADAIRVRSILCVVTLVMCCHVGRCLWLLIEEEVECEVAVGILIGIAIATCICYLLLFYCCWCYC
jgi:hypothetical protein